MSTYAIQLPKIVALPISDSQELFPVRRVYCVGRNYAAHAIEMGHDPNRESPFFFQKNPNNLDPSGEFPYPPNSNDVHYEAEVAVMLKSGGINIPINQALDNIYGYALSLDMTRRDLQAKQKKLGQPWEIGKAFERSAPVGPIHPIEKTGHLNNGAITLKVNGDLKQEGDLNHMIWKIPEMISHLSKYYTLQAGDLIMTGTPAGVGPVQKGDYLEGSISKLSNLAVKVV